MSEGLGKGWGGEDDLMRDHMGSETVEICMHCEDDAGTLYT